MLFKGVNMDDGKELKANLEVERNVLARERTRFAAERTLSSWIRTGLASVGAGFAIIRWIFFENLAHKIMANFLGGVLIIWGILVLVFSLLDFKRTCQNLEGSVKTPTLLWASITVFVFILVSLFLFYVSFTPRY